MSKKSYGVNPSLKEGEMGRTGTTKTHPGGEFMAKLFRLMIAGMIASAITLGVVDESLLATTFDLVGVTDPNLTARVDFGYTSGSGIISIDIQNTSFLAAGPDPRFTAFAFNVPANVTGFSTFSGPPGWTGLYDLGDINTPGQFGFFDMAGLTGPNFEGGSPNDGIPRASTFNFEFTLTGSNLNLLNEDSFLGLLSFDPAGPPDESEQYFIGRFQRTGSNEEGSDVAIPGTPIPEPATMLLLGSGLIGLAGYGRKKLFKK